MKYSFTRILSIGVGVAIVVALLLLFFLTPRQRPFTHVVPHVYSQATNAPVAGALERPTHYYMVACCKPGTTTRFFSLGCPLSFSFLRLSIYATAMLGRSISTSAAIALSSLESSFSSP